MALFRKKSSAPRMETSVILKRQVPIRFEETPRSWLGGLPMMPRLARWPRNGEGRPMEFLAQICCADLPPKLWDGLGPRKGWLLVFVDSFEIAFGEPEGDIVRVLHFNRLGSEREPPPDMHTMRHLMTDHDGYDMPGIRPGVPKMWRKWPVDIVAREYELPGEDERFYGPTPPTPEELYGAPGHDYSMMTIGTLKLDRPLTWRGARYYVEPLLREDAGGYRRHFVERIGLIDPPEVDPTGFRAEVDRRAEGRREYDQNVVGRERANAARNELAARLAEERKTGWIDRGLDVLDAKMAEEEERLERDQKHYDRVAATGDQQMIARAQASLNATQEALVRLAADSQYLEQIRADYPGPDGEAALNDEIRRAGEAHLVWADEQRAAIARWYEQALTKPGEDLLPEPEWEALTAAKSTYWRWTRSTDVLRQVTGSLFDDLSPHVAVREDLLDLYASNRAKPPVVPQSVIDDMEARLRTTGSKDSHGMGGIVPEGMGPPDVDEADLAQIFTISSDHALGWTWCDVDPLYIAMPRAALKRGAWNKAIGWVIAS